LKSVLFEADSDKALRLLDEFRRGVHDFLAPDMFLAEIGHALTRAERRNAIPIGDAIVHFDALVMPPPDLRSSAPLIGEAVQLSSARRASVYDCLYVVLAMQENCPVITADQKFVATFGDSGLMLDLATM
jgi:predicted nucleic acid-binding protein